MHLILPRCSGFAGHGLGANINYSQKTPRPCLQLLRPSVVGLHYSFPERHLPRENETWCHQLKQKGGTFLLGTRKRQNQLQTAKGCATRAGSPGRPAQARPLGIRDYISQRPQRPQGAGQSALCSHCAVTGFLGGGRGLIQPMGEGLVTAAEAVALG